MGLWDRPLETAPQSKQTSTGETAPPDKETHIFGSLVEGAKGLGVDAAHGLNEGFWNFIGNSVEASKAYGKEPIPFSALRYFIGSELVDMATNPITPYGRMKMEDKQAKALKGKLHEPASAFSKEGILERFVPEHQTQGAFGDVIKGGMAAVGDPANMIGGPVGAGFKALPVLGKYGRSALTSFFAGSGAETGGKAGAAIDQNVFGGEGDVGKVVGSLAGGVAGANVQDVKMNTLKEVGGKALDVTLNAAKAAREASKAKSMKEAWQVFNDAYGDLSAKSQGLAQKYVRASVALELQRDVKAQQSWAEFEDALSRSDANLMGPNLPEYWSLAQKTDNPVLIANEKYRVPSSGAEAQEQVARHRSTEEGVVRRHRSLFKDTKIADAKTLEEGLTDLARETNLKLDVLATEQNKAIQEVTNWDMPGKPTSFDKGAELRTLAEQEVKRTGDTARANYDRVLELGDKLGVTVSPARLRAASGDIMETILAQLKSGTAPESIKKLGALLSPETGPEAARIAQLTDELRTADGPGKLKINREILDLRKTMRETADKELTLRDLNDIMVALNKDASAVASSGTAGADIAGRNIQQVKDSLEKTIQGQVPDVVRQEYENARNYYSKVHAPRAKEGTNALLRREAGSGRPGEERIVNEQILGTQGYLNANALETKMREFDALFDGKLTQGEPNKRAYEILGEALENRYHKDILSKGQINPEKHEEFLRTWNSALNRVPGAREKLEDTFNIVSSFDRDQRTIRQKWDEISTHPLTKTFGPAQAKAVLERAMSDPNQMGRLVNYTIETQGKAGLEPLVKYVMDNSNPIAQGEYKAGTIRTLLNLGKTEDGRIGGLQVLLRRAHGQEAGDKMFNDLTDIALLQERADATKPERLVSRGSEKGPVEQQLGQPVSSLYSTVNSAAQGRTSPVWAALFTGGRFANAKFSDAWRTLQHDALYSPEGAEAIKAMMVANAQDPFPVKSALALAKRMGKDGTGFLQRLVDIGAIPAVTLQGARIGAKESTKEDKAK